MNPSARSSRGGTPSRAGARRRALAAVLFCLPFALLDGPLVTAGDGPSTSTPAARPAPRWSSAALELARTLPVQDGGRVKPLDTYAQFTLLRLNHKRSCQDLEGNTLSSIEWLLDVLFRPELARRYACFTVDSSEVLDSVGLAHEGKKKRDRYAYDDLAEARPRLGRLAERLRGKQGKDRSPVEEGITSLSEDLDTFDALTHTLDFARAELPVDGSAGLAALFGGRRTVPVMAVVDAAAEVRALSGAVDPHAGGANPGALAGSDPAAATALRTRVGALADAAAVLALVPPSESKADQALWFTPGHVLFALVEGGSPAPEQVEIDKKTAAKLDPAVDYTKDAKCLKCHSTGYGTESGYPAVVEGKAFTAEEEARATLNAAGTCEACHGPGSLYAPYKKDHKDYKRQAVKDLGLTTPPTAEQCAACHAKGGCPTMAADYAFDFEAAKKKTEGIHEHVALKEKHE